MPSYSGLSLYLYRPKAWVSILFLVFYTLTTFLHLFQAVRHRRWWLIPTVVAAGACHLMTWGARTAASYQDRPSEGNFALQFCASVVAPACLLAGKYITLARLAHHHDRTFSAVPARAYIGYGVAVLVASVIMQIAAGIVILKGDSLDTLNDAFYITLANVVLQLVSALLLLAALCDVWSRGTRRPVTAVTDVREFGRNHKKLIAALLFATTMVIMCTSYRIAEDRSFDNNVRRREGLFCGLAALPILLALIALNIFHPGALLPVKGARGVHREIGDKHISDKQNGRASTPVYA